MSLPSISALVDLGNVMSLRHLLPAGAHAIDLLNGDIELRFATGDEDFVAFGSEELEHPLPGEVIFAEGKTVLTRRWTWRQGNHTLTLPETTAIEFNVDGLPPVTRAEVEVACAEVAELIQRFCGGSTRIDYLTRRDTPHLSGLGPREIAGWTSLSTQARALRVPRGTRAWRTQDCTRRTEACEVLQTHSGRPYKKTGGLAAPGRASSLCAAHACRRAV